VVLTSLLNYKNMSSSLQHLLCLQSAVFTHDLSIGAEYCHQVVFLVLANHCNQKSNVTITYTNIDKLRHNNAD